MAKKLNGSNGKQLPAVIPPPRVSPAEASPIEIHPAHVPFRHVREELAWVTLKALGIEPTEEHDPRFFSIDRDRLAGWSAREISPPKAALVTTGGRAILAVMEAATTLADVVAKRRTRIVPFAVFHRQQRGEYPIDPTLPESQWMEIEQQARVRCAWGVPEAEAKDGAPFSEQRFEETVATEIVCRTVLAAGPHSPTSYLMATHPTDLSVWTVCLLSRSPLTRVYHDPETWAGAGVDAWNRRSNREAGII